MTRTSETGGEDTAKTYTKQNWTVAHATEDGWYPGTHPLKKRSLESNKVTEGW